MEKAPGCAGDFLDCRLERDFVCLRRLVESADFSHELQGRSANLVIGNRWVEVEKDFDISAHGWPSKYPFYVVARGDERLGEEVTDWNHGRDERCGGE